MSEVLVCQPEEGEPVTLDIPVGSVEVIDGVEWCRMKPDWVYGRRAARVWALALKRHRKGLGHE